jgi:membrane protease YdiL (CAAX protease family)
MASRRSKMRPDRLPASPLGRYWARTHYPLNCLLFVTPLIIAFELGVAAMTTKTDLLAVNHLQRFLYQFGATAGHMPAALILVILLAWHAGTHLPWRVQGHVAGLMLVESALLAMPLLVISLLTKRMAAAAVADLTGGTNVLLQDLLAGLGAGIYEEFLFRLVGLNLLTLILLDVAELPRDVGYVLCAAGSATLFAFYHFLGRQVVWSEFAFFFLAGSYLAAVYIARGFGVAVGTHISYNLIVCLLK